MGESVAASESKREVTRTLEDREAYSTLIGTRQHLSSNSHSFQTRSIFDLLLRWCSKCRRVDGNSDVALAC